MLSLENIFSIFRNSPIPALILTPDAPLFTIVGANEAFLKLTGKTNKQLAGKRILEAFPGLSNHPESAEGKSIRDIFEYVLAHKALYKARFLRYDSSPFEAEDFWKKYWSYDTYPLLDTDGSVQFIIQHPVDMNRMVTNEDIEIAFTNKLVNDQYLHYPLFNNYPDAVFMLDRNGNFLNANQALANLAECSLEELLQLSFMPFIPPDNLKNVLGHFQRALEGDIQHFETPAVTANGNRRILRVSKLPIVINGEVIGVCGVARDISLNVQKDVELEQQKIQLNNYNERIINILESVTDGFFAVDSNWNVTYWNKEAEKMTNMSRDRIVGKNLWQLFDPEMFQQSYAEYHKAKLQNIAVRFEDFLPHVNTWFEISAFPSKDGLSVFFKDINSRKKAEQQLREAKERYQNLFNSSPVPKWVYEIQSFQILDINDAAIKHYGYSREEFLSMSLWDFMLNEDEEVKKKIIENARDAELFKTTTVKHVKRSGEIIFVHSERNAIAFDNKDARVVLALDVTDKLRTEQALTEREQRFRALVQDGSDLIAILDTSGNYQYVSSTSKSVLGKEPEFFIGKNAFDFISDEDRQSVQEQFARLGTERRIKLAPFRFRVDNERFKWIETVITDMTDEAAVGGIVANSRDITKIIENELELKETIERFELVLKATSDTIWDWNLLTDCVIRNKGKKSMLSIEENALTHDRWYDLIHPEDKERVLKKIQHHIKRKRTIWNDQYRFRDENGHYIIVLDRGFLMYNNQEEAVRMIGAMQDVTERENRTRAIEDQNKKLREIAWSQSHLVRAPICRIKSLINLILNDYHDEEMRNQLLEHLLRSTDELDEIIRDIVKKAEDVYE